MNSAVLKKNNLFKVIQALKQNGPMTKPELMIKTNLTSASVHNFVNELLEKGLLLEEGLNASNGGRKASIYRFNSSYRHIVGVYIALHSITCCVIDLDFNEKVNIEKPINLAEEDVESNINNVLEQIQLAIAQSGFAYTDFAGIGVIVPGTVNRQKGVIQTLVNARNWRNIPLKSIIEDAIGLPTIVDKDTCGMVLHYKWVELPNANANIVHISITDGIGAGILLNGSLYRGKHHVAGEIGHMSVDPDGEMCNCGNLGCLELFAANMGIVRNAVKKLSAGEDSSLANIFQEKGSLDIEDVVNAAKDKDKMAYNLFVNATKFLVMSIGNVMKVCDPDEIVFDSYWLGELPEFFSMITNQIFENTRIVARSEVRISMSNTTNLLLKGAATLQYEDIFGSAATCPFL